jgi:hypothetical protein
MPPVRVLATAEPGWRSIPIAPKETLGSGQVFA